MHLEDRVNKKDYDEWLAHPLTQRLMIEVDSDLDKLQKQLVYIEAVNEIYITQGLVRGYMAVSEIPKTWLNGS